MAANQFPFDGESLIRKFHEEDTDAGHTAQEESNMQAVCRILAALSENDVPTFVTELDPEIELEINCPEYFPWIRRARGIEETVAAVTQNFGVLEDQTPTITSMDAKGDLVELHAEETGQIKGLGRPYNINGIIQIRFRDGKAVHVREVVSDRVNSSGV